MFRSRQVRRHFTVLLGCAALATAVPTAVALAQSAPATTEAPLGKVNKSTFGGVAIDGYDPVAYFTVGKPVKGTSAFNATYNGATYRFSSAENRDMFQADPAKYAPQYGGFCAWGVTKGGLYDIDPEAFAVVDGKLYLNYDKEVQKTWSADIPGFIRAADAKWPELR